MTALAVERVVVDGYRSITRLSLDLAPLTVIVGPNGSGKTNVYRTLVLLQAAAAGRLGRELGAEGGMPSVMWAGPRRTKESVRVRLGARIPPLEYELSLGLPQNLGSMFGLDPQVKEEDAFLASEKPRVSVLERRAGSAWLRDADGVRQTYGFALSSSESVLSQLSDPPRFPLLDHLRRSILAWRFYHHFRSDLDAPARQPQVGVYTPVLSPDAADLAPALQTIREIGDGQALARGIASAFPGATLGIEAEDARFSVRLEVEGLRRALSARELSDGTLRYLCLLAALLSPRAPPLIGLNEPETSLHPELLEPLAGLIADAAARGIQVWVTTHAEPLARALAARGAKIIQLEKTAGATRVVASAD